MQRLYRLAGLSESAFRRITTIKYQPIKNLKNELYRRNSGLHFDVIFDWFAVVGWVDSLDWKSAAFVAFRPGLGSTFLRLRIFFHRWAF